MDSGVIGGGSYTEWSAQGIKHGTAGSWQEHAAMHSQEGPLRRDVAMPSFTLPTVTPASSPMGLFLHYPDLTGVANASYRVVFNNGEVREGRLDAHGRAELQDVPNETAHVYYGEPPALRPSEAPPSLQPSDAQIRDDLRHLG